MLLIKAPGTVTLLQNADAFTTLLVEHIIERRLAGWPAQYALSRTEFFHDFCVFNEKRIDPKEMERFDVKTLPALIAGIYDEVPTYYRTWIDYFHRRAPQQGKLVVSVCMTPVDSETFGVGVY